MIFDGPIEISSTYCNQASSKGSYIFLSSERSRKMELIKNGKPHALIYIWLRTDIHKLSKINLKMALKMQNSVLSFDFNKTLKSYFWKLLPL